MAGKPMRGAMPDRAEALAALYRHLAHARDDPARILVADAARAADALARATDPAVDLTAAHALGWYHWTRWQTVTEGRGQAEQQQAVGYLKPVFAVSPDSVPEFLTDIFNPGNPLHVLRTRAVERLAAADASGQPELAERAIEACRSVLDATTSDNPHRANDLNNLVAGLMMLHERTRRPDAAREATSVARATVASAAWHNKARARYLDNLGGALSELFRSTGQLDLLREAALTRREVVAAAAPDHPRRAAFLSNLAGTLYVLYERTGQLDVLREAARIGRDAVGAAQGDPSRQVTCRHNLVGALQLLYDRTDDPRVLDEAVRTSYEAVAAVPRDHPARGEILSNHEGTLGMLFGRTRNLDTLREAIEAGREAVAAVPDDHPRRGHYLSNLALMRQMLFACTEEIDILRTAIRDWRLTTTPLPQDHPDRATLLNNLGSALRLLHERTGEPGVLAEACRALREAGDSASGMIINRIRAYRSLASLTVDPQDGLRAMENALDLVELLAPGSLVRTDREYQLGKLERIAGEAAAAALTAGHPVRAVELLERARGILASDATGMRGRDRERLRERAPELADQLDQVRARIDGLDRVDPSRGAATPAAIQDASWRLAAERRAAQDDWQRLLGRVRDLDGFNDFFRAPSIDRLAQQVPDGPVVFVTTGPTRCDALILTGTRGDPVRVVPLTALTEHATIECAERLQAACHTSGVRELAPEVRDPAQQEIREILAWLWDAIVEPVLTDLGHTATPRPGERWPRIWWCPVGVLAFLPLHAAGHYGSGAPKSALDRVVSSYTTTVRALLRERNSEHRPAGRSTVIVPVADIPGAALPGVIDEAAAIGTLVPDAHQLAEPTRDAVLAALPDHDIAHIACHGLVNWQDPARSQLILADYATSPLTVTDIGALKLSAGLAYLSACDTGRAAARLADESLHITGAFHLAGYQRVVGTLWSINDRTAAELATDFYRRLTRDGTTPPQVDRSAHALHQSIRKLRTRYPDSPAIWAGYTHTGS